MILVDTSVWIDHLRRGNVALVAALEREEVLTHPFVIGELACGDLKNRKELLDLLAALPSAVVATDEETLHLIEQRRLMGKGIGYIDAHLIASVKLTPDARLWTLDKKLAPFAAIRTR
ncbi:MAG TPA: PIN domain-containing protein [Thermoanaerobaculia bacterium]|nr:PIN domain-containing protein [Thermoanaerobaculia bacterium]